MLGGTSFSPCMGNPCLLGCGREHPCTDQINAVTGQQQLDAHSNTDCGVFEYAHGRTQRGTPMGLSSPMPMGVPSKYRIVGRPATHTHTHHDPSCSQQPAASMQAAASSQQQRSWRGRPPPARDSLGAAAAAAAARSATRWAQCWRALDHATGNCEWASWAWAEPSSGRAAASWSREDCDGPAGLVSSAPRRQ
jgi:hypothetical protein